MSDLSLLNIQALHYALTVSKELLTICLPLFSRFKINYFCYVRFFNDGSRIYLCTKSEWITYYINNHLQDNLEHMKCYLGDDDIESALWSGFNDDHVFQAAMEFDIYNGFSLYEKNQDSYSAYLFSTNKDAFNICNFYLNHLDILKHFVAYFKYKAHEIIQPSNAKKIYLTKPIDKIPKHNGLAQFFELEKKNKPFFCETRIGRFYIDNDNYKMYFTEQEMECIQYLLSHKTTKETGKLMNISNRTVESYIRSIKEKTCCNTKSSLFDWLFKHKLIANFYNFPTS